MKDSKGYEPSDYTTSVSNTLTVTHEDSLIRCPYCDESYYQEGMNISTAVWYPPIWKDGVNINPDRNTHTTHCHCLNCGKEFLIVNGKVEKVEE